MANESRMSPDVLALPQTKWLYRVAKQYGPWPKRKHWRLPRAGGWGSWITSEAGRGCIRRALREAAPEELRALREATAASG